MERRIGDGGQNTWKCAYIVYGWFLKAIKESMKCLSSQPQTISNTPVGSTNHEVQQQQQPSQYVRRIVSFYRWFVVIAFATKTFQQRVNHGRESFYTQKNSNMWSRLIRTKCLWDIPQKIVWQLHMDRKSLKLYSQCLK